MLKHFNTLLLIDVFYLNALFFGLPKNIPLCYAYGMKICNCFRAFILAAVFGISLLYISCSNRLGYSVMLWSLPEAGLGDGDLVQVYIKSNISQVYVIGTPGSQQKIEVPFWQITNPTTKAKALKAYEPYKEYQSVYASVVTDGLPVRYEPVNTSRQVYRLRKGENLKILQKGVGTAPVSGSKSLPGDWLWVMTSDGTTGWCFSYNLKLFDENMPQQAEEVEIVHDETLETALDSVWYPEEYLTMINNNQVDIPRFEKNYYFNPGKETGTIEIRMPDMFKTWDYEGAEKLENGNYRFKGTSLTMSIRKNDVIVLQYSDSKGRQKSETFVLLTASIEEIISGEEARRSALLSRFLMAGSVFSSSNYGDLLLLEDGTFSWSSYQRLVPTVIPSQSGERGKIVFDTFVNASIASVYDGVVTFVFEKNKKPVRFLYKLETDGIRFEETADATIKDNVVTARGTNALVLFFGNE